MSTPDQRLIDLGQKIIEYRNNADFKQEAFAKELGISRTTLSFIENGSQAPSFEVLVKLAQITNINFNELIDVKSKNIVVVDTSVLNNGMPALQITPALRVFFYIDIYGDRT